MNKFYFFILNAICIFLNSDHSSAQSFLWAFTANYSPVTHVTTIKQDQLHDVYLALYDDSSGNITNTHIEKRDPSQNVLWSISFPGGAKITDIEINSFNHPVFTGYFTGTIVIGNDTLHSPLHHSAFIVEAAATGNILWVENFNPNNNDFKTVDLFIDASDYIYMTVEIVGGNGFCSFHKLDQWGQPLRNEFNGNTDIRTFSHIIAGNNGDVFLSGTCGNLAVFDGLQASSDSYQNFLIKYDSTFQAQWLITRKYISFDHLNGLGSDGNFLYWGFSQLLLNDDSLELVKTNFSGTILAETTIPTRNGSFPQMTMATDSFGNSIIATTYFNKLYLSRYDKLLNLTWQDSVNIQTQTSYPEIGLSCSDSSFYLSSRYTGDTLNVGPYLLWNPNAPIDADVFLSKWGYPDGVGITSIVNSEIKIYPNPSKGELIIQRAENFFAILTITDYSGHVIFSKSISGKNESIDLSSISNGSYLVNLKAKDSEINFKSRFVLMK